MRRAAIAVGFLVAFGASAAEPDPTALRAALRAYNRGERVSVVPFGLAGVATLTAGALLLGKVGGFSELGRGAAWPLLGFGLVELVAGVVFSVNAARHLRPLEKMLDDSPREFVADQAKHAHRIVDVNQPLLFAIEGVVLAAGGALAIGGAAAHNESVAGVGIGLALQSLVLFVLDWTVLDRTRAYAAALD